MCVWQPGLPDHHEIIRLDLALEWDRRIDYDIMDAPSLAFYESDLPYKVDVVDLGTVDPKFRQIVDAHKIPLDPRRRESS